MTAKNAKDEPAPAPDEEQAAADPKEGAPATETPEDPTVPEEVASSEAPLETPEDASAKERLVADLRRAEQTVEQAVGDVVHGVGEQLGKVHVHAPVRGPREPNQGW